MTKDDAFNSGELAVALKGVAHLYEENLAKHGLTSQTVGWKDEVSQLLRFEKLVHVIDGKDVAEGISVNDLGCGYAAMFSYLDSLLGVRLTQYNGYDISEEMLGAARRTVKDDPRADFIQGSKLSREADYSFVSGTFNVKFEASNEVWADYVREILMNLSEYSRKGFAFNLLTTYVDWKQDNLFYADPLLFFDFCKRNISRYVSLLHDYPLFEWTIIVRKDSAQR